MNKKINIILIFTTLVFKNSFVMNSFKKDLYIKTDFTLSKNIYIPNNKTITINGPSGIWSIFMIKKNIKINLGKNSVIIFKNIFLKVKPENFEFETGSIIKYENCIFGFNKEIEYNKGIQFKDSDIFKTKFKKIEPNEKKINEFEGTCTII